MAVGLFFARFQKWQTQMIVHLPGRKHLSVSPTRDFDSRSGASIFEIHALANPFS
jgi:hypothetical protein